MAYDPLSSISKIQRLTGNENIVLTQGDTPTGNGRYPLEQLKKELGNKSLLGSVTPLTNDIEQGVYIASEVGVYLNFGNIEVTQEDFDNSLVLLTKNNNGTFSKDLVPMPGVVLESQINVEGGVTGFNPIGEVKEGDKRAVSGVNVYNYISRDIFKGNFKTGDNWVEYHDFKDNCIRAIKIESPHNKSYMIRTITFAQDNGYFTLNEGRIENGKFIIEKFYTIVRNNSVNNQIPSILNSRFQMFFEFEGIKLSMDIDFTNKIGTRTQFVMCADVASYAWECNLNEFYVNRGVDYDYLRRNYQSFILDGIVANVGDVNAPNLFNNVIEDVRISGANEEDIFQIWTIAFGHATLKDYIRFRKGKIVDGLPVWESDQTLSSGQVNTQYPENLEGKARVVYPLSNNVNIEIWFDFDKKTFPKGTLIAVSDKERSYGYKSFFTKAKMLPLVKMEIENPYPMFGNSKIIIFGDSITATDKGQVTWVQLAMQMLGNPTYKNFASGGAAFRERSINGIKDMPTQLANAINEEDVSAVILALGTNEYHEATTEGEAGNNTPYVGSYEDSMSKTMQEITDNVNTLGINCTMHDALRYAFYTLQQRYNCPIYVVLPIQRARWRWEHVSVLYDALEKYSEQYGCTIIDGRNCGIVSDFEVDDGEGRDLRDGLHPKDIKSYSKIGNKIVCEIRNTLIL